MIELHPKPQIAGAPGTFDTGWLKSIFVTAQQRRCNAILQAIADGAARIEKVRAAFAAALPGGKPQVADISRQVNLETDAAIVPLFKGMLQATEQAQVLSERVFDKYTCLFHEQGGMNLSEATALRAAWQQVVRGAEPIELARMAQRVIDDNSPQSLILADCLLRENFKRKADARAFTNAAFLTLLAVPTFDLATGLLQTVVDLYNQAGIAYANFGGKVGAAAQMRISLGLSKMRLDKAKADRLKMDADRLKLNAAGDPPQG